MLLSTSPANVRPVSKSLVLTAIALSTLTLAACGGGGGGGGGNTPPPTSPAQPANTAPTVQAGADQSITLPTNAVDLTGTATDAENNTLTYAWTASPAAGVSFANAAAGATRVTFTDAGTYTLTLSVSDGTATGTDTVQIVVNAAAVNTAPTVDAGADQTITLPTKAVDVAGTATDAENGTLTYAWTASPADGVMFASASSAASNVTFPTAGTYTLTLTVSDGSLTATDSVQVVVNALADVVFPGADVETDPNHGWTAVTNPADVGMDAEKLAQAEAYALTGGGSGLISRRGRLVHKWGNIDGKVDIKSTTKSVGGIALALALDDSLLTLNDLASQKLPSFGQHPQLQPPNDPAQLNAITLLQLATHTAGFEKDRFPWAKLIYAPGSTWSYSDGGLNWLSDILSNAFQKDLNTLLNERVWSQLGITTDDLEWRQVDPDEARPAIPGGINPRELASGININPNAMARIGLLYLRKGMWNGTRIISESSVQLATVPRAEIAPALPADPDKFPLANTNYAVLWWTNATQQLAEVPADAYWAWGLGDSLIIVIPSLDLVIARTGTSPSPGTGPFWRSAPVLDPVTKQPTGQIQPVWDGNYTILRDFIVPIVQAVKTP